MVIWKSQNEHIQIDQSTYLAISLTTAMAEITAGSCEWPDDDSGSEDLRVHLRGSHCALGHGGKC
jgi:hypothetical protein